MAKDNRVNQPRLVIYYDGVCGLYHRFMIKILTKSKIQEARLKPCLLKAKPG